MVRGNILLYKNNLDFILKRKFEFDKYNGSYRKISKKVVYITEFTYLLLN